MNIIITRPAEDAGPLRQKLESLGHRTMLLPLLEIVARAGVHIPKRQWQAIVATSANAIRALQDPRPYLSLPMFTVGPQSLAAARAGGFTRAEAHGGNVEGLAAHLISNCSPAAGPILYLSGSATSGDLQALLTGAGFACERVILYDAVPADDVGPIRDVLGDGSADAVLLYSPRSARIWLKTVTKAGLLDQAAALTHLCLSPAVAAELPAAWKTLAANSPDEDAMLSLLEQAAGTR